MRRELMRRKKDMIKCMRREADEKSEERKT